MKFPRVIKHLQITIRDSALSWSKHSKERRLQRGIKIPKTSSWKMIKRHIDYKHGGYVLHLFYINSHGEPIRMIVGETKDGKYQVVTVMWDYEYTEGMQIG